MSNILEQSINGGEIGYGLYGELSNGIKGDPKKVSFVQGNNTVVQFDACLNESHGLQARPTSFAVEDGSSITDHIGVAPVELQLAGLSTDTPIDTKDTLIQSAIVSTAAAAAGPLGTLGATIAVTKAGKYASLKAQQGSQTPTQATYSALMRLAGGSATDGVVPAKPNYPQLFDVVTSLKRYANMCIRSLAIQRDASTGYGMVFQLTLTQIRVAASHQVAVSVQAQPTLAAVKKRLAESRSEDELGSEVANAARQGVIRSDQTVGAVANKLRPGTV